MNRQFSFLDHICLSADQALRAVLGHAKKTERTYPAAEIKEADLTLSERKHSAGLMRVNHAGEVCAQALYQAQGFVSRNTIIKEKMHQSAIEEGDHLAWCHTRLIELGSHTSYLNPVWYIGSFAIGLTAGLIGDQWSLGFLAETENQVVHHLDNHLKFISAEDQKSVKILEQMQKDETQHRDEAVKSGAAELPLGIKTSMRFISKLMVKTAYWI